MRAGDVSQVFNVSSSLTGDAKFVDKDLNAIKMRDVVESYTSAKGRTRYRVVTPAVRAMARRHFDCPTCGGQPWKMIWGTGVLAATGMRGCFKVRSWALSQAPTQSQGATWSRT